VIARPSWMEANSTNSSACTARPWSAASPCLGVTQWESSPNTHPCCYVSAHKMRPFPRALFAARVPLVFPAEHHGLPGGAEVRSRRIAKDGAKMVQLPVCNDVFFRCRNSTIIIGGSFEPATMACAAALIHRASYWMVPDALIGGWAASRPPRVLATVRQRRHRGTWAAPGRRKMRSLQAPGGSSSNMMCRSSVYSSALWTMDVIDRRRPRRLALVGASPVTRPSNTLRPVPNVGGGDDHTS